MVAVRTAVAPATGRPDGGVRRCEQAGLPEAAMILAGLRDELAGVRPFTGR
jgi:hypothetical protein